MEAIQIAMRNQSYAQALREQLARDGKWEVLCVPSPDTTRGGVIVMDCDCFSRLPLTPADADRVVLVAEKDAGCLATAWEAGISSVVFEKDPINTAVLAIMAARLRTVKRASGAAACSACGAPIGICGFSRSGSSSAPGARRSHD